MAKRKQNFLTILSPKAFVEISPGIWTMRLGTIIKDTLTGKVYRYDGEDKITEVDSSVAIGAELGDPLTKAIQ